MDRGTLRHAIKLGLAAALAMVPVRLFDLPSGFWAPLSALAVLQNEIGASFATARNYLFASAIGIGFGTATVIVFGPNIAIAGVGIAVVALLCRRLRLPAPTVTTAGGVVPVMVLVAAGDPWRYAAFRLLDVVIGLTTAVLVGALVWPARAGDALRRSVAASLVAACEALGDAIANGRAGTSPPQARAAVARLGTSVTAPETAALSQAAQGDELLRLHALVLALKELVRDIRHLVDCIEHPAQVPMPSR